jgi:ATP-dependent exoDNAse (exonuclease V) beta subunit
MSAEAGDRLDRLLVEGRESGIDSDQRQGARVVGELVHRLFETWNLEARPEEEWQRQEERLLAELSTSVPEEELPAATQRAMALLERIERGTLLQRFIGLGQTVLGREIPVLSSPRSGNRGPVGFYSGAIDLLCRDPETGAVTIVDFKTDQVETDEELVARGEVYSSQEDLYAEAIQRTMNLDTRPGTELWFLFADRRWTRA